MADGTHFGQGDTQTNEHILSRRFGSMDDTFGLISRKYLKNKNKNKNIKSFTFSFITTF